MSEVYKERWRFRQEKHYKVSEIDRTLNLTYSRLMSIYSIRILFACRFDHGILMHIASLGQQFNNIRRSLHRKNYY